MQRLLLRRQGGLGDGGEFAGEAFEEGAEGGAAAPADGSTSQRPGDVPVAYHLRYVHTDALGSPVLETNADGQEIDGTRTQYEPYGAPLPTPHDGSPSYTGHQYDTGTGLIYAQQRYYDPQLGVFMSPDPMAVDTTSAFNFNRYAYANNSPYKFTDPDGRYAEAVLEIASLSVGLASFVNNVSSGHYLAASADAVGIAIDGIGLAVPLAPGVASLGIQASRAADEAATTANNIPDLIYRTGSQSDNALTDPSGVSFRDSISSAADGSQTFKSGDKLFAVDTSKLPEGSVVVDGGMNGVPAGHVSVNATPDQIRAAVTQDVGGTALEGLKKLDDGSFRLPK